jgi:hypothetical protein
MTQILLCQSKKIVAVAHPNREATDLQGCAELVSRVALDCAGVGMGRRRDLGVCRRVWMKQTESGFFLPARLDGCDSFWMFAAAFGRGCARLRGTLNGSARSGCLPTRLDETDRMRIIFAGEIGWV